MNEDEVLKKIPKEGFLKTDSGNSPVLNAQQKVFLIRKGNEMFNKGEIEQAKRIFLTTKYTDGLIRIGDYYKKNNQPLEAMKMYKAAPAPDKLEYFIEKMAHILQKWLRNEE